MVKKSFERKVFVNKRNKQLSVALSKKQIKKMNPSIKFGENLFVRLTIFNKERNKK